MSGLVESATAILSASERRLETVSNNVSNISTPGFKRQISFADAVQEASAASEAAGERSRPDLAQGRLSATGNPLDLAISGGGFFQLRAGEGLVYSRQGQFRLAADGTVVNPQGYALQQAGGGDLVLESPAVQILEDGTILFEGRPVARIAVHSPVSADGLRPVSGSLFAVAGDEVEESPGAMLRQGMVEASNVSLGEEMVAMMQAVRQAEGGARLVQLYDDLIGRAITAFGQGGR